MSQVGRIGGQVLSDNLLRAGIDLAFENDLLYLDVTNQRIGIKQDAPVYDLDVNGDAKTTDLTVTTQFTAGNVRINAPDTFTTTVGGIDVYITGSEIVHEKLTTSNLVVDTNTISSISNSNIVIDTIGTGTVEILSDTSITGDLAVSGNINITGNLSGLGTLTIGDDVIDTVTVNTDFTQSIELGANEIYTLGKPDKRWEKVYVTDWTAIGASGVGIVSSEIIINNQLKFIGPTRTITTVGTGTDVYFNPSTGTTQLESLAFNANDISNLLNTPLSLNSSGTGYYLFADTNGLVIPSGTSAERRSSPEVGETRWNTEEMYLECFDGAVWTIATGAGEEVTQELMEDFGNIWVLTLG